MINQVPTGANLLVKVGISDFSFLNIWQDEFEAYHQYGLCYVPQFDPQTIGTPGRIALLEDLLKYIDARGNTWFCTGSEMARFWQQ